MKQHKIILFNKPFGVLSQFTDQSGRETLANYIPFKNVYAAGRLDRDSEGLLILSDDTQLRNEITDPYFKMAKHYWVQVEGSPREEDLILLRQGVLLKDGMTRPAEVKIISDPKLWDRNPPIRFRQSIPTTWLEIIIKEGKNRQVRRMTAAIKYPTLRLVRVRVGDWSLGDLLPGQYKCVR